MSKIQYSKKFAANALCVHWLLPIEPQDLTAWNLFVRMKNSATEKFSRRSMLESAASHAFGLSARWTMRMTGELLDIAFAASWIRSDLAKMEGYEQEVELLLDQLLFHPLFDESHFQQAVQLHRNALRSQKSSPLSQAVRMAQETAQPEPYAPVMPIRGTMEALETLRLEDVQNLAGRLENGYVFYLGEESAFIKNLSARLDHEIPMRFHPVHLQKQDAVKTETRRNISQSSLALIYSTSAPFRGRGSMVFRLLNCLLGGGSVSLLFMDLRETHSLCYSVSSTFSNSSQQLMILTETTADKLELARNRIDAVIQSVIDKTYDQQVLDMVKAEFCDAVLLNSDAAFSEIDRWFFDELAQEPTTPAQMIEDIQSVTMDDLSKACQQLHLLSEAAVINDSSQMQDSFQDEEEEDLEDLEDLASEDDERANRSMQ